jgi:hypothetical protein
VPDGSGSAIALLAGRNRRFRAGLPPQKRSLANGGLIFRSFARMINPVECAYETSGGKKALACEGRTDGRAPREKRRIEL